VSEEYQRSKADKASLLPRAIIAV